MRFAHSGRFLSGLAVPLSALRGASSPGCGEYPDLAQAGELAASWGLDLIQLLPVNDTGEQTSPYSALSAFALHPLYLRIGDLDELAQGGAAGTALRGAAAFRKEAAGLVARFAAEERVPHRELLAAKMELLARIWKARPAADPELDAWIVSNPWARDYAAFVELKSREGSKPWWEWSSRRDPGPEDIEALWADPDMAREMRFHAWIQLRAEGQFRAAAESLAARGIALMGDIPILMNEDSAEVWARRGAFKLGLIAGAPPDMYAALGQNWGFPIYDWEAIAADGYGFWVQRLREADKYYSCYRIDHVLGFFRIWALSDRERTGYLGRFVPDRHLSRAELESAGFSRERLRWLSEPHVRERALVAAAGEAAARGAEHAALDRIGGEELFLFKRCIRGEKDIEALPGLSPAAADFLQAAWRDRVLYEFEEDAYVPAWSHAAATAWPTLAEAERAALEELFRRVRAEAETAWEKDGRLLLAVLKAAVPMLPCAEDLGSVPDCVPRVLEELGILGLRVLRWTRRWEEPGQSFIAAAEYPRLSVACPSVHDSTSIREWWESEADRPAAWAFVAQALGRDPGPCPETLSPEATALVLEALARSNSLFAVYPLQDLIALGGEIRPPDPRSERINVPGTVGDDNWRYRMPLSLEELAASGEVAARVRALAAARPRHLA